MCIPHISISLCAAAHPYSSMRGMIRLLSHNCTVSLTSLFIASSSRIPCHWNYRTTYIAEWMLCVCWMEYWTLAITFVLGPHMGQSLCVDFAQTLHCFDSLHVGHNTGLSAHIIYSMHSCIPSYTHTDLPMCGHVAKSSHILWYDQSIRAL